ncbi:MAG TPA: lytic murein transglycosylase [Hyphomicrobiales bacterium]|nr:lytic murein transglycosylase [Hyphomicrobiales bacterium]
MAGLALIRRPIVAAFAAAVVAAFSAGPALADFDGFVRGLWPEAAARGVSAQTFSRAFAGVTPDPDVLAKSRRQPEFTETTQEYLAKRVSDARIARGRAMAAAWRPTLDAIERTFGVDRYIVLSIWGNETNFGQKLGGHSVIRALATLAYEGDHRRYFRRELLVALKILQAGHVSPAAMIGSWAGAMGNPQFMPSSFEAYAVDFTGDGRRDIWGSVPDSLASAANYLRRKGWQSGKTWGYEVVLPPGVAARRGKSETLAAWSRMGVRRPGGEAFPRPDDRAELILVAGRSGPAFLVLKNFFVIKRYNASTNYALAVGHLADRIRGGGPFATPWPPEQASR